MYTRHTPVSTTVIPASISISTASGDFSPAFERPRVRPQAAPWVEWLVGLPIRAFWWCFGAVLGIAGWNALWLLGDTFVRDHDEGRYGVAASEMLHSHSMLVTTYAGTTEFWNLKPPLGYWLLDISYSLAGENQLGLRLPAAVCALLTIAFTMVLARRMGGPRVAILSGVALATSFGFMGHHGARSGNLDIALTLPLLVCLALAPQLPNSRAARLGAGLALALAFLVKSFAILPFLAAMVLYGTLTRGISSWRVWPVPMAILVIITATWAVARSVAEDSWEFVRRMFVEDLLLRSTTQIDGPPTGSVWWDYAGDLGDRLAPWPLLAVLTWAFASGFARRRLSSDSATLLGCYALLPLLLFTLARTHHSHYMIPAYPAWAILGAAATLEILKRAQEKELLVVAIGFVAACVLACEVRLVTHIVVQDRTPGSQRFLASLPSRLGGQTRLIHTTFSPSYSERFFLQVVDGFTVNDVTNGTGAPKRGSLVLRRNSATASLDDETSWSPGVVLARNDEYTLVRISQ